MSREKPCRLWLTGVKVMRRMLAPTDSESVSVTTPAEDIKEWEGTARWRGDE